MNLNFFNKLIQRLSPLKIDEKFCIRGISPKMACDFCQEACPQNAISLEEKVSVDDNCTNCGACVAACPAGVFKIEDPDDELLFQRAADYNNLVVACEKNVSQLPSKIQESAVKVSCLARFYMENLFALSMEVDGNLYLFCDKSKCESCENVNIFANLKVEVNKVNSLLFNIYKDEKIKLSDVIFQDLVIATKKTTSDDEVCDKSRRQFFKDMGSDIKKLPLEALNTALSMDEENKSRNIQRKSLPSKRKILNKCIKKLLDKNEITDQKLKLPFYKINMKNCFLCGTCTKLCPFSAMRLSDEGNLEIDYSRCMNCGLCLDVCINKAISYNGNLSIAEFLEENWKVSVRVTERICDQCGEAYKTGEDNCTDVCMGCKIKAQMAGELGGSYHGR